MESRDILKVKDLFKDPTKMFETSWLLECPIRTRKPGLEDFGLSKARNTKLCIRFSKQVLMRLRLERRRRSNFGILYSLKTCTVQTETQKELEQLLMQE
jgi:hypothetical protein